MVFNFLENNPLLNTYFYKSKKHKNYGVNFTILSKNKKIFQNKNLFLNNKLLNRLNLFLLKFRVFKNKVLLTYRIFIKNFINFLV
jgi:hypothetical protein